MVKRQPEQSLFKLLVDRWRRPAPVTKASHHTQRPAPHRPTAEYADEHVQSVELVSFWYPAGLNNMLLSWQLAPRWCTLGHGRHRSLHQRPASTKTRRCTACCLGLGLAWGSYVAAERGASTFTLQALCFQRRHFPDAAFAVPPFGSSHDPTFDLDMRRRGGRTVGPSH